MRECHNPANELYQWSQTSAMISAVTIALNFFLVLYSLNVNDSVVFFISICCVVIQSIVACSPAVHFPSEFEYPRANFAEPFSEMFPQRSYVPITARGVVCPGSVHTRCYSDPVV
jgi:hypothetical protein